MPRSLSTGRAAPAAAASSPHQPARAVPDGGVDAQTLAGERTHAARAGNVRGVRL